MNVLKKHLHVFVGTGLMLAMLLLFQFV